MLYKYVYDRGVCSVKENKLKFGPFPKMCVSIQIFDMDT